LPALSLGCHELQQQGLDVLQNVESASANTANIIAEQHHAALQICLARLPSTMPVIHSMSELHHLSGYAMLGEDVLHWYWQCFSCTWTRAHAAPFLARALAQPSWAADTHH